jgi:HEAT repeats
MEAMIRVLAPLISDDSALVRRDVAQTLGLTKTPTAVPLLETLSSDKVVAVKSAAMDALTRIGPISPEVRKELRDIGDLIATTKHENELIASSLERAVATKRITPDQYSIGLKAASRIITQYQRYSEEGNKADFVKAISDSNGNCVETLLSNTDLGKMRVVAKNEAVSFDTIWNLGSSMAFVEPAHDFLESLLKDDPNKAEDLKWNEEVYLKTVRSINSAHFLDKLKSGVSPLGLGVGVAVAKCAKEWRMNKSDSAFLQGVLQVTPKSRGITYVEELLNGTAIGDLRIYANGETTTFNSACLELRQIQKHLSK